MTRTSTDIRRRADGSIDSGFYVAAGQKARADEAVHLWADYARPAMLDGPRAILRRALRRVS